MERHPSAEPVEGFLLVRPNVPLTFVNADVAKDQIMTLVRAQPTQPRALVLDIGATADLDVATTDMLAALLTDLQERGIDLRLAQVRGSVRDRMRRTGLMDLSAKTGATSPTRRPWRRRLEADRRPDIADLSRGSVPDPRSIPSRSFVPTAMPGRDDDRRRRANPRRTM